MEVIRAANNSMEKEWMLCFSYFSYSSHKILLQQQQKKRKQSSETLNIIFPNYTLQRLLYYWIARTWFQCSVLYDYCCFSVVICRWDLFPFKVVIFTNQMVKLLGRVKCGACFHTEIIYPMFEWLPFVLLAQNQTGKSY